MASDISPQHEPEKNVPANIDEVSDKRDIEKIHQAVFREHGEPEDGLEPIPLWIVGLCGVAIFLGGLYFGNYTGGFRADVFNERQVVFGPVKQAGAKQVDPVAMGRRLFAANCASCHQANGLGSPGQYPPLVGSEQVNGPANRLTKIVLAGLEGPLEVKGTIYNGNMPAQRDALKDEQIAYILTYIRQEWGNKGSAISPQFVAKMREQTKDRRKAWTWPELAAIPGEDDVPAAAAPATAPAPAPAP